MNDKDTVSAFDELMTPTAGILSGQISFTENRTGLRTAQRQVGGN